MKTLKRLFEKQVSDLRRRAFSLVEVTLAVAIAAVALVTILSLFPLGLRANRDAVDSAMASAIARDIINTFQAATAGAGSFNAVSLARFATVTGHGTPSIYYCRYAKATGATLNWSVTPSGTIYTNGSLISLGTFVFNLNNPPTYGARGWVSFPEYSDFFVLLFDGSGRLTLNTQTISPGVTLSANRQPYYRADVFIKTDVIPGLPVKSARLTVEVKWPVISVWGSHTGWLPQLDGPRSYTASSTLPMTSASLAADYIYRSTIYSTEIIEMK